MAKPKNSFMLVMDVIDYEAMMKRVDELGVS